jgi:hypothetical protein
VTFEANSGFHADQDLSLDELVDAARRVTLAAAGGVGGHLSVAHIGSNVPKAGSFVEIELELVGDHDDAKWRDVRETVEGAMRELIWGHR